MSLVEALARIDWRGLGTRLVILHGSALRKQNPRDVDLVVFIDRGPDPDEAAIRVAEAVELATGLEADVYVVDDVDSANCFLLLEAVRTGRIIHSDADGLTMLVRAVGICNDYMITRRRVGYTEALIGAVLRSDTR